METSKAQIAAAANYLVQAKDYAVLVRRIEGIIAGWSEQHVFFAGERECLNALINLGLHAPDKLKALYGIIEKKRLQVPAVRRNEYQRGFMAQQRVRMGKALQIEQIVEGRKLTLEERTKRLRAISTGRGAMLPRRSSGSTWTTNSRRCSRKRSRSWNSRVTGRSGRSIFQYGDLLTRRCMMH